MKLDIIKTDFLKWGIEMDQRFCEKCHVLKERCFCDEMPKLDIGIDFVLLMHEKEPKKRSNTGQLILNMFPSNSSLVLWERVNPNEELVKSLEKGDAVLVYPTEDASEPIEPGKTYVIIDGTWQQSRKMFNKSPYLQNAKKVSINRKEPTAYELRRTYKEGTLSTAEAAMEILKASGDLDSANTLNDYYKHFMKMFK